MSSWKEVLTHLVADAESHFDALKYGLGNRLSHPGPILIQTYRGFGTREKLFFKGRVLENPPVPLSEANDDLWDNLVHMFDRFESDEIPYARLNASFQGVEEEIVADEEGYFQAWIQPLVPLPEDERWQAVELELLSPQRAGQPPARAEAQVYIPPAGAQYGVISDIDDTVVQTDAAHLLRMARNVFLGNARTRLPFKGVAAFYRALFEGARGQASNPLFYVSSSPWNLYDLLAEFFQLNDIPIGPVLFLRDWGITENELLPTGHIRHKLEVIHRVMDTYPDLPFILMGDSGQEDPEIYARVVNEYPHRILAIYIRNVSRDLKRPEAIRQLAKKVAEAGSTLILADDTVPMAEHAAAQGWIDPATLPDIREEKKADEAPPTPVEKLLGVEPLAPAQAPAVVVDASNPGAIQDAVDAGLIEESLQTPPGKDDEPPSVIVQGE